MPLSTTDVTVPDNDWTLLANDAIALAVQVKSNDTVSIVITEVGSEPATGTPASQLGWAIGRDADTWEWAWDGLTAGTLIYARSFNSDAVVNVQKAT